jgi:recombinational DNA repair protein (RecF pathway)
MPRAVVTIDERDLERALLRKSVGTLASETHRCADCGRTPLIGETAYRYERGETVCELCRPLRRDAPLRSEPVRNSEAGLAVRIHRLGATSPPPPVPE